MKIKGCLFLLFSPFMAFSQENDCDCRADLLYIKAMVEKEHPGFKVSVKGKNTAYEALFQETLQNIDREGDLEREACAAYINEYLSFIRDKHLKVDTQEAVSTKPAQNLTKDMTIAELNEKTYYVKLPTFFRSYWQELDHFYDTIIPLVNQRPQLVIDLRNNTGGGPRMYQELLKNLQKAKSPSAIYLIYNRFCASACEHFVAAMKKSKKVVTFGENSYGALAYGMAEARRSPHCRLRLIFPTKKYNKYLDYEVTGIPPDHPLPAETDWIEQATQAFEQN